MLHHCDAADLASLFAAISRAYAIACEIMGVDDER
jgi:hypothetical protein